LFQAIVKAALLLSDEYTAIQRSTKGVVFFSTPHQGGNGASLGDIFANIGLFLLGNPSNDYLKTLKRNLS
jgi:protein SERAC1